MSGRITVGFVDFAAVPFEFDRVSVVLLRSFLVRWRTRLKKQPLLGAVVAKDRERGVSLFPRPFTHDAVHLQKMLPKLFKREAECKESFRRFAFHAARQSLAPYRAEFLDVIPERYIDGPQWGRGLLVTQRCAAGAEKVASLGPYIPERRR